MERCYQMSAVYLFLIACQTVQIVRGQDFLGDLTAFYGLDELSIPGYHFETLDNVVKRNDPRTYKIMSLRTALLRLGGGNHKGKKNNKDGGGAGVKNKRDFVPYRFSFWSRDEAKPGDEVVTTRTIDGVTTRTIDGVSTTTRADGSDVSTDSSGHNALRDDDDDGGSNTTTDVVASYVTDNFVSVGKNVASDMMAAAPYLPLVFKVAVFIVPGLSSYYVLVYAVNVAIATAQAVRKYQSGQSVTSVTSEAGMKLFYDDSLSKRDIINTEDDNTSNIHKYLSHFYTSLKDMYHRVASFRHNSQEENLQSKTYTAISNNNDKGGVVEITSRKTKVTYNDDFPKKVKMKCSEDDVVSYSSGSNDDEDSDSSKKNYTNRIVEIDEADFQELLEKSTALQPEFIRCESGKKLVDYLNRFKIELPEPKTDSKKLFEDLTCTMKFDKNITDEKKAELNEMLSKITDYYIAMALEKNT